MAQSDLIYCIYDGQPVVIHEAIQRAVAADDHGQWQHFNYADAMTKAKMLTKEDFDETFRSRHLAALPADFIGPEA